MKLISFKYNDSDGNIRQVYFRDTETHHIGFKILDLANVRKGNINNSNNVMVFVSLNDFNYFLNETINEKQMEKLLNEYFNFFKSSSVLFIVNDIIGEIKKINEK